MEKMDAYKQAREETRQEIICTLEQKGFEKKLRENLSHICVGLVEEGLIMAQKDTPEAEIKRIQWLGEYLIQCLKIGFETYNSVIKKSSK